MITQKESLEVVIIEQQSAADLLSHAITLHRAGNINDAETLYQNILNSEPKHAYALNLLGTLYAQRGNLVEGIRLIEKAITIKPDYAEAYYNCGQALQFLGKHEEALIHYDRAIAMDSNYAEAYNNRGLVLYFLGQYEDALSSYDHAITINPNYADAYWNKGLVKLLLGEYKEGWKLYEWRWQKSDKFNIRILQAPLWLGEESLLGKTILLHAEQGFGDAIQFCRYVPLVEALGARILLEVPAQLAPLFLTIQGSFNLVVRGDPIPKHDFHCPLESLPLALGTTLTTIPNKVPYLFVDMKKQQLWQERLGVKLKPRIGLMWSGSSHFSKLYSQSIPLNLLAPLCDLDFDFHSLQKEVAPEDDAVLMSSKIVSHAKNLKDFSDTAALIEAMDLVISIDTSVAHLAGALGKKTWVLIPGNPDFRWLTEREDSPWYPTARLFRQQQLGDWPMLIAKIKEELESSL